MKPAARRASLFANSSLTKDFNIFTGNGTLDSLRLLKKLFKP